MQCHLKHLTSPLSLYNSKARGRGTKSSHLSSSKKHFLMMLLWSFIIPHSAWTALHSCAERQEEYIWSCITSGSVLCFPFQVTIKLGVQCTCTDFPLPNTGNKRKSTLPHFLHAENKRKRSPAPRTICTERNSGGKRTQCASKYLLGLQYQKTHFTGK